MTTKPAEPKARRRKRSSEEYSFTAALETAEKLLFKKRADRKKMMEGVALLDIEIGGLEGTMQALIRQLNPGRPAALIPDGTGQAYVVGEVPEGAGSILSGPEPQQTAPDLDTLPGMEGEFA